MPEGTNGRLVSGGVGDAVNVRRGETAQGGANPSPSTRPKHLDYEDLTNYFPQKTPLSDILELYPAVSGKLFSEIILPSKGKKPDSCEAWSPTYFCPNCGKPHFTKGNCGKSTCPDCAIDWRYDRAQSIMERVLSLKIQRKKRCRHFVVSPEVEDYPEDIQDLKNLRKEVYEFAKSKGVQGGVVLFHPFRILPDADFEDSFRGWKSLLEKDMSEILNSVYFAPHFHIIGVGEKGKKTFESAKESDKFVFKGIGELSDSEDLGKCVMYLLSHLGIFQKSHYSSIVWFGSLSSSTWSLDKAQVKLRNGSTVKEFTLDLVEDFIGNRREEENGSLECSNCGVGLLHISSAPDYWEKENFEFEAELKVAYEWWRGSIPPPENLESRSDCWKYLQKIVNNRSEVVAGVSKMVEGKSCLRVISKIEPLGGD
ncbi:MAG: hypothetical protein V5A79_07520 [Candidatus Bipolaricaulota bacterium]